ncbi:hypothetical protein BOSEA31B_10043 [Hyphomicrobiales bacterium]|nr:hypothetical protein BOSEA31B_10043 [Hyphomicrobiales bacterium]CAH1701722.1 hypothetical protein BOSEA1005_21421 [Hyphomicrobiales bacterium]CAI0345879.1 hypothetical protein BO1005MUT1_470037 [Hyphomicrobiales bacterium]
MNGGWSGIRPIWGNRLLPGAVAPDIARPGVTASSFRGR